MKSSSRDYYDILDVGRDASPEQIKAAYRFQLKAFHPDKFSAESVHARRAQERIHQIVEAYRTLSDSNSRAEYDRFLKHTSPVADDRDHPKPPQPTGKARGFPDLYRGAREVVERRIVSLKDKLGTPDWWKTFLWVPMAVAILVFVGVWFLPTKDSSSPRSLGKLETTITRNESPIAKTALDRLPASGPIPQPNPPPVSAEILNKFDLPTLARNTRKAVVMIVSYDANGKVLKTGSGFFVSDNGRVVTNRHVINNVINAIAKTEDGAIYIIVGALADSASLDLAVLKAEAKQVPFLTIQAVLPEAGSRIAIIGSPLSLEGSLSEGIVSAIRAEDNGTWIQVTAPISPGSSGSPVLDSNGQVVGVATRVYGGLSQNLNFARSSQDLAPLIQGISKATRPRLLGDLSKEPESTPPPASSPAPTAHVTYRVEGLPKKTPFLNIRVGPGVNFGVVGTLKPEDRGIILGPGRKQNGTTVWQEVTSGSLHGWVNAEYLVPETSNIGGGHNLDNEVPR